MHLKNNVMNRQTPISLLLLVIFIFSMLMNNAGAKEACEDTLQYLPEHVATKAAARYAEHVFGHFPKLISVQQVGFGRPVMVIHDKIANYRVTFQATQGFYKGGRLYVDVVVDGRKMKALTLKDIHDEEHVIRRNVLIGEVIN